ncbi:hypothetical protein FZEAL_5058 [Fusarium zealandicum]|uniref:Uncharacterized protein n=1 Tax=Fusarium zealandicum TaxID=1053134 RepID=A0A8H4XKT8_9HYPO|nr:hypothetical protein FZEAL_5058 [Fusarium zealandicum]
MSQKAKNGNIMSFFKPAAKPQTPQTSVASTPHSPSPLVPSSPRSQKTATPVKALSRDREIQASDEDDDFASSSDDSLEDLSTILGRGRPGKSVPSPTKNLFATPKAKRTAVEFHSSPLTIIPKHKFDLKALAKDARQDDATNASSRRANALSEPAAGEEDIVMATDEASRGVLEGIVKSNTGQDAQKVLRAVQRSEPGQSQLRYCFFSEDFTPPNPKTPPKSFTKGPWRLLTQGDEQTREQHLASGLPLTLLHIHGGLPDELFEWILDELCVQKSSLVRQEYCNLLKHSSEQVERLVTPRRLEELFYRFGASSELEQRDSRLTLLKPNVEPYEGRDFSALESFVSLTRAITPCMSLESVVFVCQTLLRMSMDKFLVYNINLLVTYEDAIKALLEAIPQSHWDSFCSQTCSLLHTLIKAQCIRTNALVCLPISDPNVHELRRRLAVTFLFDDPNLGRYNPDNTVTIRGIIDRLDEDDFLVGPKTDFAELQANIILLNISVDDGSFSTSNDPDKEKQFNSDVDELTVRLRGIWRKINDAGMKLARTEAKSVIEWVQQRLAHSVRTRKKAKKSVFDLPGQREDPFLPRQQDYMKSFLQKAPGNAPEQKAPEQETPEQEAPTIDDTEIDEDTIVVKMK